MKFLSQTRDDVLTLSTENRINSIKWYIDASFRVHPDYKSHLGGMMKFKGGKGTSLQKSVK